MAVYEYLCPTCQKEFELTRPMSESDLPANCPQCNSQAQKLASPFGSMTGGSIQASGQSFGSTLDTRISSRKMAKATKGLRRANKRRSISDVARKTNPCPSPGERLLSEGQGSPLSAADSTVQTITGSAEDAPNTSASGPCRAGVPIDISWLIDYQPRGSNLWAIHDWGIASIMGYPRDSADAGLNERSVYSEVTVLETATHVAADLEVTDGSSPTPITKTDDCAEIEIDKTVEDYVSFSDRTNRPPAIRPWLEEATTQSAEPGQYDVQITGRQVTAGTRHPSSATEKTDETFSEHIIVAAWKRQGGRCASCGRWLIWTYRNRQGGIGAWQPHSRIQASKVSSVADCVILCSSVADCHFNIGHGGIGWNYYAPLSERELPFLADREAETTGLIASAKSKRSLLRAIFGIPQPRKP